MHLLPLREKSEALGGPPALEGWERAALLCSVLIKYLPGEQGRAPSPTSDSGCGHSGCGSAAVINEIARVPREGLLHDSAMLFASL